MGLILLLSKCDECAGRGMHRAQRAQRESASSGNPGRFHEMSWRTRKSSLKHERAIQEEEIKRGKKQ